MSKARNVADLGSNDVLETTSTGVDVTGELNVSSASHSGLLHLGESDSYGGIYPIGGEGAQIYVNGAYRTGHENKISMAADTYSLMNTANTSSRVHIDSDGKVGIGYTSPQEKLNIAGSIQLGQDYYHRIVMGGNDLELDANGDTAYRQSLGTNDGSGRILFKTAQYSGASTERMRIESSGAVGIGTTSPSGTHNALLYVNGGMVFSGGAADIYGSNGITPHVGGGAFAIHGNAPGNGNRIGEFNQTGGDIFRVFQNRNGANPYFYVNTSGGYGYYSDERLKENITEVASEDSVSFIQGITPVEFNWKEENGDATKRVSGFIAQDVLANAVTEGQKNILTHWEEFDENDPDCPMLGFSDHRILPSIVGALQNALSRIEALEAEVQALKG